MIRKSITTECRLDSGCKSDDKNGTSTKTTAASAAAATTAEATKKSLSLPSKVSPSTISSSSSSSSTLSSSSSSSSSSTVFLSSCPNTHKKSSSEGTMGVASGVANGYTSTDLTNQLQFQTKTISHACDSGVGLEDDYSGSTGSSIIGSDVWSESSPSDGSEDEFIKIKPQLYPATPSTVPRSNKLKKTLPGSGDVPLNPFFKYLCLSSFGILFLMAYVRNFLENYGLVKCDRLKEKNRDGYPPLIPNWLDTFTEYIYRRVSDIFAQPISGNPGQIVNVLERVSTDRNHTFRFTGKSHDCINLASYDYLGMSVGTNIQSIQDSIQKYGVGVGISGEFGRTVKHRELEQKMAQFMGKEDCVIFGMGFATNSANIQAFAATKGNTLIIGDQHCHMSIRQGIYISRTQFRFFKHNDFNDLERMIQSAIRDGNKKTGEKWSKIIIIVEGVYSMEGTIVDLPRLIEIKKKYKCYLYVDEAHSIGAVGPYGGGVVDYFGCNPNDVDLLMGTMTKTFAAAGGYIACSRDVANHIRANSIGNYSGGMSAPVCQQIIDMLDIVARASSDPKSLGKVKIDGLLENTHYMRDRLKALGFVLYGHYDSPVIPILVYFPSMAGSICRMAVKRGLALVVAGYPATSLPSCRIRLCMSASLDRKMLDRAIDILSDLGDQCGIKHYRQ